MLLFLYISILLPFNGEKKFLKKKKENLYFFVSSLMKWYNVIYVYMIYVL